MSQLKEQHLEYIEKTELLFSANIIVYLKKQKESTEKSLKLVRVYQGCNI